MCGQAIKSVSILAMAAILTLPSCTSVPSERVNVDRMAYGEVVAESWKRQTLLNVVRLRHADAPVFLDVASVINSYSVGGRASAGATLPGGEDPDIFNLGVDQTWSNTPTITYQPLLGDRFTKSLLQPIPPSAVFQLTQGGWAVDLVMKTVVRSINGLRNDSLGVGADPKFHQVIEAMTRIQHDGALGIRVEPRKDGAAVVIVLRPDSADPALQADGRLVLELLGLKPDVGEFEVVFGLFPRAPNEVAIISRSMLELMLELGVGIELEPDAVSSGRAAPGPRQDGDTPSNPLVNIRSGEEMPTDTYTAVRYRDRWYWIDDTDIASKRIFTFLMILFSLAETGQGAAAPVVTVPSR